MATGGKVTATGLEYGIEKTIAEGGFRRWDIFITTPSGSGASESEIDAILNTMRGSLHSQT